VNQTLNGVSRFCPPGREAWPPSYRVLGAGYMWRDGFSRPEWPRARGKEKQVNLASKPSCLVLASSHVQVWPSSWSSWSCSPCRGMAWRSAIVPVVSALLAWRWFTNCPVWCGLAASFIIVSCSPGGVVATVREQAAALGSLVAFSGRDAADLDPGLPGRGLRCLSRSCEVKAGVVRPIL
jgi:hypothetical protein